MNQSVTVISTEAMKLLLVVSFILFTEAFSLQSPSNEIEGRFFFQKFFNPEEDVKFFLFTRENPFVGQRIILGDVASLLESNFNISNPTRFFIHGWGDDSETQWNDDGTEAYLRHSDLNVIRVDWRIGAQTINYVAARNRVDPTGRVFGNFIDFLHESNALRFEELTVVGFSLGAHIAGIAGKFVRRGRIDTIIGLDPAGPLFSIQNRNGRLASSDAEYVEVIHTNGGSTGFGFPIGDADFFPNGGRSQPGCLRNFCSHGRAPQFFIESINSDTFYARRCETVESVGRRCRGELVTMGGEPSNSKNKLQGIYFLTTNRSSPFSRGEPSRSV